MNYSIYDHIINIFINKIIKFHLKKKQLNFINVSILKNKNYTKKKKNKMVQKNLPLINNNG